jgi:hypothetical protein
LRRRLASPQTWVLATVLAAGLVLRLSVAAFHGFFGDVQDWVDWGDIVNRHFFSVYSVGAVPSPLHPVGPPPAFGPLALWVFGGLVWIYRLVAGPVPDMNVFTSGGLAALMKLPSIVADLSIGVILYRLRLERFGWRRAAGLAALWVLSPVGIMVGAVWGQVDLLPVPFLLLALWAAHRGRPGWAGVSLGLALLWKPQALVFAPIPMVYLARWMGRRAVLRASAAAAGVLVLAWLPYAGEIGAYLRNFQETLAQRPLMTTNAWNLWWLVGTGNSDPSTPYVMGLTLSAVGWILFAVSAAVGIVLVAAVRSREDLFLGAAVVAVAFFVVAPMQHERYMVQSLPLILAASVGAPGRLWWYAAGSAAAFANMFFLGVPTLGAGETVGVWSVHTTNPGLATLPIALAVVLLLVSMLSRSVRGLRPALRPA